MLMDGTMIDEEGRRMRFSSLMDRLCGATRHASLAFVLEENDNDREYMAYEYRSALAVARIAVAELEKVCEELGIPTDEEAGR